MAACVLRRAGHVLNDPSLGRGAVETILPNPDRCKMAEDHNGIATTGLLYVEDTWDTSHMGENAEASLACIEAYTDTGDPSHLAGGLNVLRAVARHHHGPFGFLIEGVGSLIHPARRPVPIHSFCAPTLILGGVGA